MGLSLLFVKEGSKARSPSALGLCKADQITIIIPSGC